MARGRGGGKDRFRKIRPLKPVRAPRRLEGPSRFEPAFKPRSMAAWMDRYAKEQDRLWEHAPAPEPEHLPAPSHPVVRHQAPPDENDSDEQTVSGWEQLKGWFRRWLGL